MGKMKRMIKAATRTTGNGAAVAASEKPMKKHYMSGLFPGSKFIGVTTGFVCATVNKLKQRHDQNIMEQFQQQQRYFEDLQARGGGRDSFTAGMMRTQRLMQMNDKRVKRIQKAEKRRQQLQQLSAGGLNGWNQISRTLGMKNYATGKYGSQSGAMASDLAVASAIDDLSYPEY